MAHPGLYAVIVLLSVIIIAGALWVFWPESSVTPDISPTPAVSSDWKLFVSQLLPLQFRYPPDSTVIEDEYLTAQGLVHTGKQVHYGEANGHFPPFDAITDDFSVVDSTPHDIVDGPLDSTTSFRVTVFDEQYEVITEVEPGMFRVDGYGNIECSPFISTLLVVRPPKGSGLEYVQFYLGSVPDFAESDMREDDTCSPTDAAIRLKLTELAHDRNIAQQLELARAIARTIEATGKPMVTEYRNEALGLRVVLPDSWVGYGVTMFQWTAEDVASDAQDRTVARGPLIHIVHPSVAGGNPYQDIPIMVFAHEEWARVSGDHSWSVSAAPMPPTELARNDTYVFALPARYNYAFPPGWEEVDELIRNGAVTAF